MFQNASKPRFQGCLLSNRREHGCSKIVKGAHSMRSKLFSLFTRFLIIRGKDLLAIKTN